MKMKKLLLAALPLLISAAAGAADGIRLSSDRPDGICAVGETVRFTVTPRESKPVNFKLFGPYDRLLHEESFVGEAGVEKTLSAVADRPQGWRAQAVLLAADGVRELDRAETGILISPGGIQPARPEPADFDAFWDGCRAELAQTPLRVLERVPVELPAARTDLFDCFDVKLAGVDATPVSGYLTMPKRRAAQSLPAVVVFHGFGVQSAVKQFSFGDAIVFDVNVHGLPNGRERAFYAELMKKELRMYHERGRGNRHRYYFRNVYLRNLRALEFVRTLPEWDGRNLTVAGGSQGGAQALAAAALDPQVTRCLAAAPALCDHAGLLAGRESGWPRILRDDPAKIDRKVLNNMAYYDNVFFARRIKAPVWLSAGLVDRSCSASSVYAVFNQLPGTAPKRLLTVPDAGHKDPRIGLMHLWRLAEATP